MSINDMRDATQEISQLQELLVKEPKPVPTIGRIVHCYGEDAAGGLTGPYAAIVVRRSHDSRLWLAVFTGATTQDWICSFSEEPKSGCWSWPPRVP